MLNSSVPRAREARSGEGTLKPMLGEMQHRAELYDLIDYEGYNAFDTSVYNFEVRH